MTKIKVLNTREFSAINEDAVNQISIREYGNEILSVHTDASEGMTHSHIIIVVPSGMVEAKELDSSVSEILCNTKGGTVFSVGRYCHGEYLSGGVLWDDRSLCVSLRGAVCDTAIALSAAIDILFKHSLPRILIVDNRRIVEIVSEKNHHRIKRAKECQEGEHSFPPDKR